MSISKKVDKSRYVISPDIPKLIRLGQRRNKPALEKLIACYQERIARFVIHQTREHHQYEDICQTVFIRMILSLPKLKDPDKFESWLFQIARNTCRDHFRKQARHTRIFVPLEKEHEYFMLNTDDSSATEVNISQALNQLPSTQRKILELHLEKKRSYNELANLCNISVSAVKSRLHRARERLIQIIKLGNTQ